MEIVDFLWRNSEFSNNKFHSPSLIDLFLNVNIRDGSIYPLLFLFHCFRCSFLDHFCVFCGSIPRSSNPSTFPAPSNLLPPPFRFRCNRSLGPFIRPFEWPIRRPAMTVRRLTIKALCPAVHSSRTPSG